MKNFWEFFAGLGIFLYAMWLLEDALKQLAGRTFKLFLKKYTSNTPGAIASGTLVTAVLQSSTLTTLMILAFVAAGALTMRNAFAVVLGANIGTTISSWIVAVIGISFSLESLSFPLMALAGPGIIFLRSNRNTYHWSRFVFAFGMLFLGFHFMKDSMLGILSGFDFAALKHLDASLFILAGFIITVLVQSSSATMVMMLAALNANILPFETAVAVVTGSEMGTAVKFYYGSSTALTDKKRITMGNIIFNGVITVLAYVTLPFLISFVTHLPGIDSPLLSLVAFQSTINIAGVILFYPFLERFEKFLLSLYKKDDVSASFFTAHASTDFPEEAIELMEKETRLFLLRVMRFNLDAFHIHDKIIFASKEEERALGEKEGRARTSDERYNQIKQAEGEILSFLLRVKREEDEEELVHTVKKDRLVHAIQNAMYSAKGMKDIIHNRRETRSSADDDIYGQYRFFKRQIYDFYVQLNEIMNSTNENEIRLKKLYETASEDYENRLREIYDLAMKGEITERDMATLLNMNREVFSSSKAIVRAVNDWNGYEHLS